MTAAWEATAATTGSWCLDTEMWLFPDVELAVELGGDMLQRRFMLSCI